jgi:hypothetical protein
MDQFWLFFGGLVGATFALARLSLSLQRTSQERWMHLFESHLQRGDSSTQLLLRAIDQLAILIRDQNRLLNRFHDQVDIQEGDEIQV